MGVALSQRGLLLQDKIGKRIPQFIRDLTDALRDPRFIWVPLPSDILTALDKTEYEAVITHNSAQPARQTILGDGLQVSWDGAANNAWAPNNTRYSFNLGGLGVVDLPFSAVVVANVTDTVNFRPLLAKYNNGNVSEWAFNISTADALRVDLFDQSVGVAPLRVSNAAITQGVPRVFGFSYDGTGGATAANGITLYEQGVVKISTATNQPTYVAMENTAAVLGIGARQSAAGPPPTFGNWMQGTIAMAALSGANLTATEHAEITALCKAFYGI